MFPHMYKVRPPRPGRRGEAPSSAECEWQGDTRRRSNSRWNPNSWENSSTPTPSASTPASPLPAAPAAPPFATPPPIPAPPPEGQETLTKMTSPAARLDGVDATNQANFNASPMPWRRERSRTSSPAAKQTPVRRRERPVSGQGQEPDARVTSSPIPTPMPVPVPGKENNSRTSSPAPVYLLQDLQQQQPQDWRSRDSSPAVKRLKEENRSRTSSPKRPSTPSEQHGSRPESASPIPTMEAPAYAKTFTPPVPLEAVVVDATSPQPQTFTTTVPIVIERQPQDQKPETHRSASPLPAHQLQQQKQQRQQTPVQQLQAEDQQQQQQQRRRQRTSSPAVPPHHLQQEQQQTLQPAAAEVNSRDSRSASPAVVFQMDCDSPAVGQVPPVEKALPQENNAFIEDNMFLKENVPLECYAPMDVLPVGTDEFQDIMSTLGMDKDAMDEFRKVLDISNDIEPPPMETMEPPADNASVEEIEGKQPPPGSELAQVFAARKAAADHRGLDPAVHTFADLSSTPNKSAHFPEPHTTTSSHSSRSRQRPEDSIPVPTPPSQPQEVPHSHEDGNVTQESSTPVTSASHKAEKKVRARAASPEPPVIAPPPKSIPPPPPEMPGKHIPAPPPPPMPGQPGLQLPRLRPMTERKRKTIDSIKKAARSRPDWFTVMKDIESGVQLRRVDPQMKSDRSRPIMPSSRGRNGKFVYESEKPNLHNELLNQIQRGVRLRKTRTNDRSKVDFKTLGLRKLRRQVTVEEKEKKDDDEPLPSSSDEEEDIDKMRDDLQATKNQLCEELKSRKKLERENKIMKIDVDSLNAQIKKLKRQLKEAGVSNGPLAADDEIIPKLEKSMSRLRMREEEEDFTELDNLETEINNLKSQADAHKKVAEDWERKYHDMEQKLQVSETSADEWESRSIYFEKKFRALQKEHNIELPDIGCVGTQTDPSEFPCPTPVAPPVLNEDLYTIPRKSSSRRSFSSQFSRMESFREEESEESERSETEEEEEEEEEMGTEPCMEEDDGGDDEASVARRAENEAKRKDRDLKLWKNKLAHMKEKEGNVQRERYNLRERIKKYFRDMKTEREEYLKVKAEMDELAGVVKEPSEDEEESEEEEQEEELPPEAEDGSCWFEEPTPKPKKLKKRKKKKLNADGDEIEDDEEEEDLEDLSLLEEPEWTDSEYSESETDNEDEDFNSRLSRLSDRTRKHELHMNKMKKDNYLLKTQVERADEMYLVERRRHQRQDEELHMILAEM